MTAVDSAVREFSIALYPPTGLNGVFLCVALLLLLAAGMWLGMRLYLHLFGVRVDGEVTDSVVRNRLVRRNEFSAASFVGTHHLKIAFTGPDGVKRTVRGTYYSSSDDRRPSHDPRVGGTVPVLYSKAHPGFAMFYDPIWHYITPIASLAIALLLAYAATKVCYEDIRTMNVLALADSTRTQREEYRDVIIESSLTLNADPQDVVALEWRGDANFGDVQFGDAIEDYSKALNLRPDRRELLLKRAKAEWLNGRDIDALRDWWKYR